MNFRDSVFNIVSRIPSGRVATYKSVARRLGDIKKARAVGNALNSNRDFKNIPCHRVVHSDGKVSGYVLGAGVKIKKLREEGIEISKHKLVDFTKHLYKF